MSAARGRASTGRQAMNLGTFGQASRRESIDRPIEYAATGNYIWLLQQMVCTGSSEQRALNSRLSQYVLLAAAGETVLVTDRGRVVAECNPPNEVRSRYPADEILADLVWKVLAVPPAIPSTGTPLKAFPVPSLSDIYDELRSDRDGR